MDKRAQKFDILIAGGGAAGIGLAASLRKRDKQLKIGIIEPSQWHYYQPSWTLVGGGAYKVKDSKRNTKALIPQGVTWIESAVKDFEPDSNQVKLSNGETLEYQQLAVALGL